ncbi:MAG: redox-regulated ATPase YchF [Alphaproteobacteria bacterium]|jgi:ribosome-binding ATPase|nr:redox-regulated ATPase YchF [Alphaproteobacteria bacterium]MBT5860856.1 redox-regulated ATPase YchF [Alphaproteobacteria bacterium]
MGFNCGIVGLPNVGKSTLFNALTATAQAQAANYPFTTIEPNVGRVPVPDARLDQLAVLAKAAKITPTTQEFVDIAGLVKGASAGEGLGNQFLGNIREVDAILHVLRCFEEGDVTHVEGRIDPVADAELVRTELLLADLESLERQSESMEKKAGGGDKDAKRIWHIWHRVLGGLRDGIPVSQQKDVDYDEVRPLNLITAKPVLYVANVDEAHAASGNAHSAAVEAMAVAEGAASVTISAALEAEIAVLEDPADRAEFLGAAGLTEPGLTQVIRAGYGLLGLITFFTAGPTEARAWTIPADALAPQAAGRIHGDMERGFIRAETIAYDDYIAHGGEQGAKAAGAMRSEGKEYQVKDGDVMLFRFNV